MADDPTILPPGMKPSCRKHPARRHRRLKPAAALADPRWIPRPGKPAKKKKKGRGWMIAGAIIGVLVCGLIGLAVLNGIRENRQAAENDAPVEVMTGEDE